jgi:hypothetical protein
MPSFSQSWLRGQPVLGRKHRGLCVGMSHAVSVVPVDRLPRRTSLGSGAEFNQQTIPHMQDGSYAENYDVDFDLRRASADDAQRYIRRQV